MPWRGEVRVVPRWTRCHTYSWGERTLGRMRICTFACYSWLRVRPNGADELSEILSTVVHVCTRERSYWNWQQAAPIFFAFRGMTSPMFIQNGFSNKVQAVTARMEAAYKLRAEFKQNIEEHNFNIHLLFGFILLMSHRGERLKPSVLNIEYFFACACVSVCVCYHQLGNEIPWMGHKVWPL